MFRTIYSILAAALIAACSLPAAEQHEEPTPTASEAAITDAPTSIEQPMAQLPEIIYVGDPMCSWCYGISNEVAQLKTEWSDRASFRMIMGGLRPNETEPMDAEMKDFLRHHWEEVHKRSGQPFSYDILERNDFVYNTEPPSRAVVVAQKLAPGKEFAFFKAVQTAFYLKSNDTHVVETYFPICDELGIDREAFRTAWESPEMKAATQQEFQLAGSIGVRSFPTVVAHVNDSLHALAIGYAEFDKMDKRLEKLLKEAQPAD